MSTRRSRAPQPHLTVQVQTSHSTHWQEDPSSPSLPYPANSSEVTSRASSPTLPDEVTIDAFPSPCSSQSDLSIEVIIPRVQGPKISRRSTTRQSISSGPTSLAHETTTVDGYSRPTNSHLGLVVDSRDGMDASATTDFTRGYDYRILRPDNSPEALERDVRLGLFAPNQVPTTEYSIPHLPPASPCQRLTSLPIWLVQRDLEFAAKRLMSPDVYRDFASNATSRQHFRDFLVKENTVGALDCEWDGKVLEELAGQIRTASQGIYDSYIGRRSQYALNLPQDLRQQLLHSLKQLAVVDAGLSSTQKYLTDQLYSGAFQRYCKYRLIESSQVKLGSAHLTDDMTTDGLGDCFCVTNPRLHDHPIVLCSDGFVAVTGYPREAILGRNCRFLQGPGTSPDAVVRIREGIRSGEGCTELLLNYRLTGEPFWCLICIIPLRDLGGKITYFIGGQVNVTSELASGSKLDFLIPGKTGDTCMQNPVTEPEVLPSGTQVIYSPTLKATAMQYGAPKAPPPPPKDNVTAIQKHMSTPNLALPQDELFCGSPSSFADKFRRLGWNIKDKRASRVEQIIPGAEEVLADKGFLPLQDQFGIVQATYSKVLVLNIKKREIIFVTPQLLAFLGLPIANLRDRFDSRLVHTDLLELITGDDKHHQKALRETAKNIVKSGKPGSILCSFKYFGGKKVLGWGASLESKQGALHLTPLKERGNKVVAYCALFGETRAQ